jgi:putative phage-type endonuclease
MSAVLKLVQGSAEWHAHRAHYRNASESAAVMGLSPFQTPYQLWMVRTGRMEVPVTAPMRHGSAMEPMARAAYEERTGLVMQPLVLTDEGDYSASLDGITLEGDLIVEIKCPYKGQASALWQSVSVGEVPEHYRIQVQHQLMVAGATLAHLFVYDGTTGLLAEIERDEASMSAIRAAWDVFQKYLDTDTPPPLSDGDTAIRADTPWSEAAVAFLAAKRDVEAADAKLEEVRERLVALCQHPREQGAGVTVTRYWKNGSVEYKRVPELQGVDLDRYRGKGREEIRVTLMK